MFYRLWPDNNAFMIPLEINPYFHIKHSGFYFQAMKTVSMSMEVMQLLCHNFVIYCVLSISTICQSTVGLLYQWREMILIKDEKFVPSHSVHTVHSLAECVMTFKLKVGCDYASYEEPDKCYIVQTMTSIITTQACDNCMKIEPVYGK